MCLLQLARLLSILCFLFKRDFHLLMFLADSQSNETYEKKYLHCDWLITGKIVANC